MRKRNDKRKQTQKQQAAATPKLHPRGLARNVAKTFSGGRIGKNWRKIVASLPRTGRKFLHPERHIHHKEGLE